MEEVGRTHRCFPAMDSVRCVQTAKQIHEKLVRVVRVWCGACSLPLLPSRTWPAPLTQRFPAQRPIADGVPAYDWPCFVEWHLMASVGSPAPSHGFCRKPRTF